MYFEGKESPLVMLHATARRGLLSAPRTTGLRFGGGLSFVILGTTFASAACWSARDVASPELGNREPLTPTSGAMTLFA